MIEFMDEDELLAEFHKAGIWLPDEWPVKTRTGNYTQVNQEVALALMSASRAQQLAMAQQSMMQQQRVVESGPNARGGTINALGGLLGGLF